MSRLKEIENMYEYVKRASDEEDGNNVQQTLFKLFSEYHIDWLIGRVKELEESKELALNDLVRKEIQWFSELMNKRMEENDDKDSYGWKHLDSYQLSAGIQKNGQNIIHGVNTGDKDLIINSAADIANYAMMIADNANRE